MGKRTGEAGRAVIIRVRRPPADEPARPDRFRVELTSWHARGHVRSARDLILDTIRSLQPGVPAVRAAGPALADQNWWIGRAIR